MSDEYYCDFTKGKYRTYIKSTFLNYKKKKDTINSNVYRFISTQGEEGGATVLSSDIAVSHTVYNDSSEDTVWFAYVTEEEGIIRVKQNFNNTFTKWRRENIAKIEADKISMAFNADIYGKEDYYEFITDEKPYIAYIKNGALYIINLNDKSQEPLLLAAENVTDVSIVRSSKFINNKNVDYGFTVFFLIENDIYYRQMINGIWYDAEIVNISNNEGNYVKIEAFHTWDFRTGILVTKDNGKIFQIISYPEGLFNQEEHIEMNMSAIRDLRAIAYKNTKDEEHIEMSMSAIRTVLYGYSASVISINNIEDNESNWGKKITLIFNYPNTASQNLTASMFTLTDSNNINYVCDSWELSQDGYILTLSFDDFNLAIRADDLTLTYTMPSSGGLLSPAVQTNSFSQTFIPINLVDPGNPPEYLTAWNDASGNIIWLKMDKPITNKTLENMNTYFGLSLYEYNYVPNGTIQTTSRAITSIQPYDGTILDNNNAVLNNTEINRSGAIRLEVELNG